MVLRAADDSVVCGGARLAVDQSSGRFDVHAQVEQLDTGQMMRRHDGMVEAQAGAAVDASGDRGTLVAVEGAVIAVHVDSSSGAKR